MSLGAPAGWLVIQELFGVNPLEDLISNPGIYIYLGVGTALAFLIFGLYVGSSEKKIEEQALVDPLTGMDIDHFKNINDTHGHVTGDKVLISVADTISATLRKADIAVRWGGEEFVLLMPGTTLKESGEISERVRKSIEAGTYHKGVKVTVSIGITDFTRGDSLETMIKRADKALYDAKDTGRNRVLTNAP